jgi:2-oxo-3-hexenedioate decarboxylase
MTDTAAAIAARILEAHDAGASIARISDSDAPFDVAAAHRVATALSGLRVARGQRPVGWKIGYTNRALQKQYGVLQPIWGRMYDTTVGEVAAGATAQCSLAQIAEPRIEPEIVVRLMRSPEPGMSPAALIACVDRVGHGFEVVTSVFREWKGTAADSIAAGSLHARYFHGPLVALDAGRDWLKAITEVEVTLFRDGVEVDRGVGANALDGPLHALGHFVDGLHQTTGERLQAGDIVTTGTLTQAMRVHPGETWSTEIRGLPLSGMRISFS